MYILSQVNNIYYEPLSKRALEMLSNDKNAKASTQYTDLCLETPSKVSKTPVLQPVSFIELIRQHNSSQSTDNGVTRSNPSQKHEVKAKGFGISVDLTLMNAIREDNVDTVKAIVESNSADIRAISYMYLFNVFIHDAINIFRYLLEEANAHIVEMGYNGRSLLERCVDCSSFKIFKYLTEDRGYKLDV